MPKWTTEQQEAIDKEGTNIIVSAGAGSGKTAVLTERVIRKLKSGVNVTDLLIMTFTKAAAREMKERIRNAIKKDPSISKQLDLIDAAYITTFDSYSLSIVKKYYYLLGIDKNINIVDSSVIYCEKESIIDSIFDEKYKSKDENFEKLISDFCSKDDKEIKKYIFNISSKLDLLYDKSLFLDGYIDKFYDEDFINKRVLEFNSLLVNKIKKVDTLISDLSNFVDSDYFNKFKLSISDLLNSNDYESINANLDLKLPNLPKGSLDEAKDIKERISNLIKEIKSICIYDNNNELKESVLSTKKYVKELIDIIVKIDTQLDCFKRKNNVYEFNDISKMAIKILEENKDVCLELKNSLNEIMVDEYQDTSDLQEKFISLIENNNVYMVGDIKQSIYRFRNANPYIFKNKYDNYSKNLSGYKIDLNKNFRSRSETLENINMIFNIIMDDYLGGASYKETHQMVFGNTLYLENDKKDQNNNIEFYNYEYSKDSIYTKDEIEAFIVANDIKNKVNNKYQVFDKEMSSLRDSNYNDFVILVDRATKFDLYKKIFEYLNIPLTKYIDTSITEGNDILIIKNLIGLLIKYYKNEIDVDFKYYYTSIARSYLFRISDNEIFNSISNNSFSNAIMDKIKIISCDLENKSISSVINQIIEEFCFYENLIKVGNIEDSIIRLEYIYDLAQNCEDLDYNIQSFFEYLNKLIEDNYDIKVSIPEYSSSSVKIMTIHKSKGLEYPVCYYTGIYSKFNISDVKEKFLFDNKYGIITPYIKEGVKSTFYKTLFKDNYPIEEISEKIRLFYVALTRCREKMIVVSSFEDKTMNDLSDRNNYKSFLDMLNSVYNVIKEYITNISIDNIEISKDYNLIKSVNYKKAIDTTTEKVEEFAIKVDNKIVEKTKYSKDSNILLDKKTKDNISFGTLIHHVFEMFDFKSKNLDSVDSKYRSYVDGFLNIGIDFDNCNIFKEYEFVYDNSQGIIDLMLEYTDHIKIIDYKLNDISDPAYIKQLEGYKKYIETKTNKCVKIYLYSIINGELKELKG